MSNKTMYVCMYVCIYYDLVSKTFMNEKIVMKCNVKNQMLNT